MSFFAAEYSRSNSSSAGINASGLVIGQHHSLPTQYVVGGALAPSTINPVTYELGRPGVGTLPLNIISGGAAVAGPADSNALGIGGLTSFLPVNMGLSTAPAPNAVAPPPAAVLPPMTAFVAGSAPSVVIAERGAMLTPDYTHTLLLDSQVLHVWTDSPRPKTQACQPPPACVAPRDCDCD